MKTVMSENEVNRVPVDAVTLAFQKLPYDGQDEDDRDMARHFLLKGIASKVNSELKKIEDKIKDGFKSDTNMDAVKLTKNYRREITTGTPRQMFNLDTLIAKITAKYPQVPAHVLRELAADSKAPSAAPLSIEIEYIGDTART